MARKSRRTSSYQFFGAETVSILRTAAYVRLSREKDGGGSIRSQIKMIRRFISDQPDMILTETYSDNGSTGTNFDRPEFGRLMADVYSGRIQCIVVKDLSRFGRDLIETGNYIENIFPKLNVRFIALTDDFDSSRKEDRDSIAIPIKNMVNAMYARDISRKQVASFELHSRLGDKKISCAPYGYTLNKAENRLEPDPETLNVVRLIFKWYSLGCGVSEIARRLNDLNVRSPASYKTGWGEGLWIPKTILDILGNEAYIGSRVLGKRRSAFYRNIPTHSTSREEWFIHENTHQPIVSREEFLIVRQIRDSGAKIAASRKAGGVRKCTDKFHLKVKCRECGRTMVYFPNYRYGDAMTADYKCYAAGKCGNSSRHGCGKKIHEDYVRIAVLDAIRELLPIVADMKIRMRGNCRKMADIRQNIADAKLRLSEILRRMEGIYEHRAEDILTAEEYRELHEHYVSEEHRLKENIAGLSAEMRCVERKFRDFSELANDFERIDLGNRNNEQALFDGLIESIFIDNEKNVEVVFKCADILREMEEFLK